METWKKAALVILVPTAILVPWVIYRKTKGLPVFGRAVEPQAGNAQLNVTVAPKNNAMSNSSSDVVSAINVAAQSTQGRTGSVKVGDLKPGRA